MARVTPPESRVFRGLPNAAVVVEGKLRQYSLKYWVGRVCGGVCDGPTNLPFRVTRQRNELRDNFFDCGIADDGIAYPYRGSRYRLKCDRPIGCIQRN